MENVCVTTEPVKPETGIVLPRRRRRYLKVNAVGLPRAKIDDREALAAARALYRFGRKLVDRPFKGPLPLKIVYGNVHTRVRRGYVNPCNGWHGLVHDISHSIVRLHTHTHEWLERQLAEHVVAQGWLDGKLRRPEKAKPPKPPVQATRYARVLARIKSWQSKRDRADRAIRKLARQKAYYERRQAAL